MLILLLHQYTERKSFSNEDSATGTGHQTVVNETNFKAKHLRPLTPSVPLKEKRKQKIRIWKNVAVISLSFMCLFTAYYSVANLQVGQ